MTDSRTPRASLSRALSTLAVTCLVVVGTGCERSENWNQTFHRSQGWWYSDGGGSAALPDGKTIWLFGDTWIRGNGDVLFNSMAVQDTERGRAPRAGEIRFFGRDDQGSLLDVTTIGEDAARSWAEPQAAGQPTSTWLWPSAAVFSGGKFVAMYTEIGCDVGEFPACRVYLGNMGFRGHSVVEIDNPMDAPERWVMRTTPLLDRAGGEPYAHRLHWGSALLEEGGWLYVFGTELGMGTLPGDVKLARVMPRDVARYDLWQFLTPRGWQMQPTGPFPEDLETLAHGGATELSVHRVVHQGEARLVMVHADPLAQEIIVRTAPAVSLESARWTGPEAGAGVRRFSLAALDPAAAGGMNWSGRSQPHHSSNETSLFVSYFSEKAHSLRFLELPFSEAVE